jgi:hypothetical protein
MDFTGDSFLLDDDCNLNELNFLGIIACTVRQTFKEELEKALVKHRDKNNVTLKAHVPSGSFLCLELGVIY